MSNLPLNRGQLDFLLSPAAIRAQAQALYQYTLEGRGHFKIHQERFQSLVQFVMEVIQKNYPNGNIPFHSRWGHFRAGGINRVDEFKKMTANLDSRERARAEIDLVVTSVLLDAGAGAVWKYQEAGTDFSMGRSEGLGVASYHMFKSGIMSSDKQSLRADREGLQALCAKDLEEHFQVSENNPLVGVAGRLALLNGLAKAVSNTEFFSTPRPGAILDYLESRYGKKIPGPAILRAVLDGFGSIWPGRLTAAGDFGQVNLGDVWRHEGLTATRDSADIAAGLVPLHKLSQWLTYSLMEPIMDAGFEVTDVEGLTGLAEYRNGGLLLDKGLLTLVDPLKAQKKWKPDTDLVIEWRALTVYFLDRIGSEVQVALGKTAAEFPLAKVLEGGTWWAGRFAAKELRSSGEPPLQIESDGTVF